MTVTRYFALDISIKISITERTSTELICQGLQVWVVLRVLRIRKKHSLVSNNTILFDLKDPNLTFYFTLNFVFL
jgi:hypothetical protein